MSEPITARAHNAPQVGHGKFAPRAKQGKALWMLVKAAGFEEQRKQLRPENSAAGGIKSRSKPEALRMAIYNGINELFLKQHPFCEAHSKIFLRPQDIYRVKSNQTHHKRGRDGLLLFDVRHFLACCADCHAWIDANREKAAQFGLLDLDNWRKEA